MRKRLTGNQKKELVLKQNHLNDKEIERLENYPHAKKLDLNAIIVQNQKKAASKLTIKPIIAGKTIDLYSFLKGSSFTGSKVSKSKRVDKPTETREHTKNS
jgi:hypothetical protein